MKTLFACSLRAASAAISLWCLSGCGASAPQQARPAAPKQTTTASSTPASSASTPSAPTTPSAPPGLLFLGRFDTSDPNAPQMAWPNSTVAAQFSGASLAVRLGEKSNPYGDSEYDVTLDGNVLPNPVVTKPGVESYVIASTLPAGVHTVYLTKRTETSEGVGQFFGFTDSSGQPAKILSPPARLSHHIEFIGDSEFTGYGAMVSTTGSNLSSVCPSSGQPSDFPRFATVANADWSVAAFVAQQLDADFVNISFSGKGIASNIAPTDSDTLPVLYSRTLPDDPSSTWSFSNWSADVVVIDAGGNDIIDNGDPTTGYIADPNAFIKTYVNFVSAVRSHYPKAAILCAVNSAAQSQDRSVLTDIIGRVVQQCNVAGSGCNTGSAQQVFYFDYFANDPQNQCYGDAEYNNKLGYGCDYHPSKAGAQFLAGRLAAAVKAHTGW